MAPDCPCAACRTRAGETVAPVPFSDRYAEQWQAETRAILGKPPLPDVSELPADVRRFVEREL